MFSGLIKIIGTVIKNSGTQLTVVAKLPKPALGDSIAINGVCLTVVSCKRNKTNWELRFDASEDTIEKTTVGELEPGDQVHVEPALRASDSLGGHIVQGHVDGVGQIVKIQKLEGSHVVTLRAPDSIAEYLVSKASVTVDGISLTVVDFNKNEFTVAIIPYTWNHTTLKNKQPNDNVNLEADIMAKYVARYAKK